MIKLPQELIQRIRQNIKIYHPNITDEYLQKLKGIDEILSWSHPEDRIDFYKEIKNLKKNENTIQKLYT